MEANERGPRGVVELGASQSTGVCGGAVGDGLCLAAIGRRRLSWTEYKQHPDREWHPFGKPAGHLARAPLLAGCKLTEGGCGSSCRLAMWGEDFCFVKKKKKSNGVKLRFRPNITPGPLLQSFWYLGRTRNCERDLYYGITN